MLKVGTNEFAQYQEEVDQQCRFIIRAGAALEEASLLRDRPLAAHLTAYHGQQLLTAAGIASMLLWGPKGNTRIAEARKDLRDSLNVTDASPLKPRGMRDSHAHIDERITDAMNMATTVVTMRLGRPPTDPLEAARPVLRHYELRIAADEYLDLGEPSSDSSLDSFPAPFAFSALADSNGWPGSGSDGGGR